MKLVSKFIASLVITASFPASAFQASLPLINNAHTLTTQLGAGPKTRNVIERNEFIKATNTATITSTILVFASQADARGRATLDQAYDRYTPRILDGGQFYKSELYKAISKADWKSIESATAEPPKKTREDLALQDGGIAKRAALAGGFSNSRVLVAMDLFAATFSDSSITPKTKAMKAEVEKLREVVEEMNKAARLALGEEKSGGGLFGIGGKAPSQGELAKRVQELYVQGGNAYNQYVYVANEGLPVQLNKLPYL